MVPFFSIVMPVFNAEKYIVRAVNSITCQRYKNFELIIVDDCSQDSSLALCKQLKKNDSRIKVISLEKNMGAAHARNVGISVSTGIYIGFVDADDCVDDDVLDTAYKELYKDYPDCLKFGVIEEYYAGDNLIYSKQYTLEDNSYKGMSVNRQIVYMEAVPLFGYMWNGFYKHSIIDKYDIKVDESRKVNEDFVFNIEYFLHVENLKCISYSGYHYMKGNPSSLSNTTSNYTYNDHLVKINSLLALWKNNPPQDVMKIIFWMYTRFILSLLTYNKDRSYASLVKLLDMIYDDNLYKKFLSFNIKFNSIKKKFLVNLLKSQNAIVIYMFILLIRLIRFKCAKLFLMIKK